MSDLLEFDREVRLLTAALDRPGGRLPLHPEGAAPTHLLPCREDDGGGVSEADGGGVEPQDSAFRIDR